MLTFLAACTPIAPPPTEEDLPVADAGMAADLFAYDPEARPVRIGEMVPDLPLIDATGESLSLRRMRGRVVVLTFFAAGDAVDDAEILQRFAGIETRMAPRLAAQVQLVCVLLDNSENAAEGLPALADPPTGGGPEWTFVRPTASTAAVLLGAFEIAVWQSPDGAIRHTFSTLVIDRDGRLADRFPGLEGWSVMDVVAAASQVAER